MSNLVYAMGQKFDKYWKESKLNVAVVIATVLDPTKKSDFLEFFFEKYCENVDDIEKCLEGVKDMMRSYYEKYEEARRTTEHSVSRQVSANIGSPVLGKRRLEEEFAQYKSRRRSYMQPKSELDMYLEENFDSSRGSFDILIWWKTHAEKYPVLSTMARYFLAIPLSTVSSESAFSCSGRTLGDSRCSMTPEMLEALVCGKDWLIKIPNNEGPSGTAQWRKGLMLTNWVSRRKPG
uniref:HAT C-terminal dimerisation domain-containing protein n=1 Tax=Aegilops tauschii subsp. strangulata TaxID=200361 RepID=A0A453A851_AEGTS